MDKISKRLVGLPFFVTGVSLFLIGLAAINHIVNSLWPFDVRQLDLVRQTALGTADATGILDQANRGVIVAFMAALLAAVTGLVLPLIYYLNKRFRQSESYHFLVIFRQAMWVGIWFAFCAWMQMNRTFGVGVAFLSGCVLVVVELLMQLRSHTELLDE
jgi:hypothetical protein